MYVVVCVCVCVCVCELVGVHVRETERYIIHVHCMSSPHMYTHTSMYRIIQEYEMFQSTARHVPIDSNEMTTLVQYTQDASGRIITDLWDAVQVSSTHTFSM